MQNSIKNLLGGSLGAAVDLDSGRVQAFYRTSPDATYDNCFHRRSVQRSDRMAHAVSMLLVGVLSDLELSSLGVKEQEEWGGTEVQRDLAA
ncbi:MAG: hypothetical protein WBC63_07250 [Candidatus Bipolaricaulia bacterium]